MDDMTTTKTAKTAKTAPSQHTLFHVEHSTRKPRRASALETELRWWMATYAAHTGERFAPESEAAWGRERACLKRLMTRLDDEPTRHAVLERYAATLTEWERQGGGSLRFVSDLRLKRLEADVARGVREAADRDRATAQRVEEAARRDTSAAWRALVAEVKAEWNVDRLTPEVLREAQRRLAARQAS